MLQSQRPPSNWQQSCHGDEVAGYCSERNAVSSVVFQPNILPKRMIKNRLKDKDGYTRRAGCVCFKSEQEEEVLLVSSCRHPGRWVVPSGGVERGEDWKEAAVREVEEEAGVRGTLGRFVGEFQNDVNQTRTAVYVLIVTEMLDKWEEDRTRSWFPIETAKEMLNAKPYQQQYLDKACSNR